MLKQILSLLPLKGAEDKAQRHQCSTWGEAGVSKAPHSHPVPWKLDVLHVVLHSLAKTMWLCYGTRISLLQGSTPPLSYHPRLSPVCSTDVMTVLLAPWYPTSAEGAGGASPGETGSYQWQFPRLRKAGGLGLLPCPGHLLHLLGCYAEGGKHNQTEDKASKIMCVCRHPKTGWSSWPVHNTFFQARH